MKKKIFLIISNLGVGGAQKSIISFLNTLPNNKYDIDLMVVNEGGLFTKDIPEWIHIVKAPERLKACMIHISLIKKRITTPLLLFKILISIISKVLYAIKKNRGVNEWIWSSWSPFIPNYPTKYDCAISYLEGFCNIYLANKVTANKKIMWVHSDYKKLAAYSSYDLNIFKKANNLITISDECKTSLQEIFPSQSAKIKVLENISSPNLIYKSVKSSRIPSEYQDYANKIKLVSIGRLNHAKGFDLAIEAASILNEKKIPFIWYIVGNGELHEKLSSMIEKKHLSDVFKLLGARSNPYPYITHANIFIQPSRFEGKSIVLDEAKILHKPIIATNYSTVRDNLTDEKTGLICEINASALANAICKMIDNPQIQIQLTQNLAQMELGNEKEIENYMKVIDSI